MFADRSIKKHRRQRRRRHIGRSLESTAARGGSSSGGARAERQRHIRCMAAASAVRPRVKSVACEQRR
ncbi:hypothetical protein WS68_00700 [Burkholderia sp. TSV86]|nr:hypothetical protein WS68_00700 [Burkholderia sp. TSV86]